MHIDLTKTYRLDEETRAFTKLLCLCSMHMKGPNAFGSLPVLECHHASRRTAVVTAHNSNAVATGACTGIQELQQELRLMVVLYATYTALLADGDVKLVC